MKVKKKKIIIKNKLLVYLIFTTILLGCSNQNKSIKKETLTEATNDDNGNPDLKTPSSLGQSIYSNLKQIPFYDELVSHLNNLEDTIYICNRNKLKRLNNIRISGEELNFMSNIKKNRDLVINIKQSSFEAEKYDIQVVDSVRDENGDFYRLIARNLINNKRAYGIDGSIPHYEIELFEIYIDHKQIQIPIEAYDDLFNLNLENTEIYLDTNENIHLYLNGGDAAGAYSVKYVFNDEGYQARIITALCNYDFIDGLSYGCV